ERNRRAAFLTGSLNVGFQPEYPCSKLIVVAGLDAADHAVDVLGFSHGGVEADKTTGTVVFRLAPAVADVGAPIHARPGVDRSGRGRRRVSRPRVHVCGPCGSRRQHNESSRSKKRASSSRIPRPMFGSASSCLNVSPAATRTPYADVRITPARVLF